MKFQHRVLATYGLFIAALVLVLFTGFVFVTSRFLEDNLRSTYQSVIDKALQQFDNQIRSMEFLETTILSSKAFKQSLALLGVIDRTTPANLADVNEARQTVQDMLYSYSILKNFYAVNVFNKNGDYFSSNFIDHSRVTSSTPFLSTLDWIPRAEERWGKRMLLPPSPDAWNPTSGQRVFSLVRAMPGGDGLLGYMEVQSSVAELERIFQISSRKGLRVLVWSEEGQLLYSSRSTSLQDSRSHWARALAESVATPPFVRDPATGTVDLVLKARSAETGATAAIILDQSVVLEPVGLTATLAGWIGLAIVLVSVVFSWWSSRQLTRPLRLIQERMKRTDITDLTRAQDLSHPNDEIIALHDAFEGMKSRLDEAITQEIRSRTLGVEAQLESLQAQVNPHFLYNILTVLAAKGLEAGSREVGEICGGIAQMLRYSTDTREKSATLTQELNHSRTYLNLMQKRFEDRLTVQFEVSGDTDGVQVPKIVIQQLVENSLNHGFETVSRPMEIAVRLTVIGDEWELVVEDNGQGFTERALEQQRLAIQETEARLATQTWSEGLAIGGLGLRNTYGRLHLFYRGQVEWTMGNRASSGAFVRIRCSRATKQASGD